MNSGTTGDSNGYPGLLLAGLMEHLACYLQTDRAKSAHRALVLLASVAEADNVAPQFAEHCQRLYDVLGERLARSLADLSDHSEPGGRARPFSSVF